MKNCKFERISNINSVDRHIFLISKRSGVAKFYIVDPTLTIRIETRLKELKKSMRIK